MHPLFTVHAGEFIVGNFIEHKFPTLNVWIPAKDTGIDLLVTNRNNSAAVSLQVKFSRDYKEPKAASDFDRGLVAAGWMTLAHEKIANSTADYWVFVLVSLERKVQPQSYWVRMSAAIIAATEPLPLSSAPGAHVCGVGLVESRCPQM